MATASPTSAETGAGQSAALTRRTSLRLGLRRNTSRSQLSRSESNSALSSHASRPEAQAQNQQQHQQQSQPADHDSSDDEIPVPMKLSALTKALLNDGGGDAPDQDYGRIRTRAQTHRPSSPSQMEQQKLPKRRSVLNASVISNGEERRQTRASSAQPPARQNSPAHSLASRDASPVRKRVVRLSSASQGSSASTASAASQFKPKRISAPISLSSSTSQTRNRRPSIDSGAEDRANMSDLKDRDINTPGQQGRVVRIALSSSGNRGRPSGSVKGADSASRGNYNDAPEEPQTAARPQPDPNIGSVSLLGSNGSRGRGDENPGLQSLRIKRVGKVPGSFLSGPARRGRRRQSEEDAENEGGLQSQQDADNQQQPNYQSYLIEQAPADNYYAPDRIASGSPVSAKASARAGLHRAESIKDNERGGQQQQQQAHQNQNPPIEDEIVIPHYRIPPPLNKPDMPSRHDQENEVPSTFKREKPAGLLISEKDFAKPAVRQINVDENAQRPVSPERKALTSLNRNTPCRAVPPPPPKMSILDAATSTAGAATTSQAARRRNYMKVNGKCYTRIDSLGRGGSSKVYRVAADNGQMFALKRVSIENADEHTVKGYKGEIDLLKRLTKVERVITLVDYEMNDEKQMLSLLMEIGELSLEKLIRAKITADNATFDPAFVRFYWQEMLECVAAVHAHDIVHSDLKPANFVLVKGQLKLIDFGIADAIQTDETVNVHREAQVGTPNYMSPESMIDSNTVDPSGRRIGSNLTRPRLMKLGKPSDIWSLGCILFQMVYGQPPFAHIPNQMARCHAIINWQYEIEFPSRAIGDVPVPPSLMKTMKRCLTRDQRLRPTCEQLLSATDPFLHPIEMPEGTLPITEELLSRIVQSVVSRCREHTPSDAEVLSVWPQAYWGSIARSVGQDVKDAEDT
ncbi:kinase-like protein [Xylaria sp. CBS 124048]|nr:kinase-like protein [Xylaria sp. CBS 124048]